MANNVTIGIDVNDGGSVAKVNKSAEQLRNTMRETAEIASKIRVPAATAAARQGVSASQPKSAAYMAAAGPGNTASDTNLSRGLAGATGASGRDFAAQAQGLGGLVHVYATFAANLYAVSAAFGALSKAMDLSNMVKGLDQIGASSGRSLGGLAKQMVLVADGAISMRDAMNSTALASAGGMSNANILRMTEVAKKASLALGRDLPDSMDRLTKGIVKTQPELLDELGIMTRVIPAQEAYARELGKTASSLTDFEKKQAFANAVLAEGERKFSAIDLDANPYSKILASMSNLMQTGLELINKVLSPVLTLLSTSPTALAVAMAGIAAVLLKQAIPAIGMFREQAQRMQTETTTRVQKQINEQQIAAGLSDDIVRRSAETKFRIEQAGSKKIGELQRQEYTKATVGKEVKGLLRKNPLDLSDDERNTIEAKYQDLQKKIDTNTATAAQKSATTTLGNRLKFHNELFQQQEDAGTKAIAAKVAEDQRFYSHETLRAQQLKKLKQAEAKAGVLAGAADNAAVMGPVYAWRQLKEETDKLDASGASKFFTRMQGGFSILTSAVGNLINVYGMWAMAAGVVYGLLDSYFTKNAKEMEALSQASGQLDSALDNVNSTIKAITANKDPLHFISVEASNARANALQTVVEQMDAFSKKTKEAIEAQRGWDKSKNWIKGLFGASVQDEGAEALAKSISAAFKIATEGPERAKAAAQVKKLLNIDIDPSSLSAVKLALDSANYAENADELYKITNEMSHSISNIASNVKSLNDSFNTAAKSYDTIMISLLPTDNVAKLGYDLIKTAQGFDKALEKPADAISEIAKTSKDMSRLKLLDPEFAGLLMQGSSELTEMADKYSTLSKDINTDNKKQFELQGKILAIQERRQKLGGTLLPIEKTEINRLKREVSSYDRTIAQKAKEAQKIEKVVEPITKQFASQQYEILARGAELVSTSLETSLAKGAVALGKAYAEGLSGTVRGIQVNATLDKQSLDIDIAQIKAQLSLVEATDNLRRVQEEVLLSDLRAKADKATGRELVDLTSRINKLVSSISFGSSVSQMNTKELVGVLRGTVPGNSLQVSGADLRNRGSYDSEGAKMAAAGAMAAQQGREAGAAAVKGVGMQKQAVDVRANFATMDLITAIKKDELDISASILSIDKARLDIQSKSSVYADESLVSAQIANENSKAQIEFDKLNEDYQNRINKAGKDSVAVGEINEARQRSLAKFQVANIAKAIIDAERLNAVEKARLDFAQKLLDIKNATLAITANKELAILEDNLNLSKELGILSGEQTAKQSASLLISREKQRSVEAINNLESARQLEENDYEKKRKDLSNASVEAQSALNSLHDENIEKIDASLRAERAITANKQTNLSIQGKINTLNSKLADTVKNQEYEKVLAQNVLDISNSRLDLEQQFLQNQKELGNITEEFYITRKADLEISKLQLSSSLALLDANLAIENAKEKARIADIAAASLPITFKGPEGAVAQATIPTAEQDASNKNLALQISKRDVILEQTRVSSILLETSKEQGLELEKQNKLLKEQESLAQSLATLFGEVGAAMGETVKAIMAGAKAQDDLTKSKKLELDTLAKATKPGEEVDPKQLYNIEAKYRDLSTKQELTSISNIAGASKKMFGEKTAAYKVLDTVEKASYIAKLAMSAKELYLEWMKIPAKEANAAADKAGLFAKGQAAILSALNAPPPFNFIAYAAVAAIVGSIVGSIGGGGGASIDMTGKTAAERQTAQGAGTVSGDDTAKSQSISNSLDILNATTVEGLSYSNKMVELLSSIRDGISGVAQGIYGVVGLRSGSQFGTQEGTSGFSFLGGLFGSSTTKQITDAGLKITGSFADVMDNVGKSFKTYEDVLTTSTSSFLWFSNTKQSLDTQTRDLDSSIQDSLSKVFNNAGQLMITAGEKLGMTSVEVMDKLAKVDISTLASLRGLKGKELDDALNSILSSMLDTASSALFVSLRGYNKLGEGMLETAMRVIDGMDKVNLAMTSLGRGFVGTGLEGIALSDAMIKASGGLSNFLDNSKNFADKFLTSSERLAPKQAALNKELTSLGFATDLTKDQFKQLVLGFQVTDDASAKTYAKLLGLSNGVDELAAAAEASASSILDLEIKIYELKGSSEALNLTRQRELDALDASLRPRQRYINALTDEISLRDKLKSAYDTTNTSLTNSIKSLQDYKTALIAGASSTLSPAEKYAQAKAIFDQTATAAQAVITASSSAADIATRDTAVANLAKASDSFLANSRVMNASGTQYAADFAAVTNAVDVTSSALSQQKTDAEKQLGFLDTIATATDTTAQLLEKYLAAVGVTAVAQASATASGSIAAGATNAVNGLTTGMSTANSQSYESVNLAKPVIVNTDTKNLFNNDALIAEVKSLREEVSKLREDQKEQTGHLIATTFTANARNAEAINNGNVQALNQQNWKDRSRVTID